MTKDNSSPNNTRENHPRGAQTSSPVGTVTKATPEKRVPKRMASAERHKAFIKQHGAELIIKPLHKK